ncbi:C6 transcription factor [Fusarium albosuccineum]|uniref:C6 transcription factor n=1 Tax=Fusarium albosuccineum TaxID=1237068 RepID=A0A8H4LCC4_9HYPO|nr:C6 transcription factor [Fusarium albosuccineum]
MPRSKVDPRLRRRVAQACDTCKRRKEKCNGVSPCNQCQARGVEYDCRYSKTPQPPRDDGSKRRLRLGQAQFQITAPGNGPSGAMPTSLQHGDVPIANTSPSSIDLQIIKDSKGKFKQLRSWAERPSQTSKSILAIIHLALAIGLQGRAQGDSDDAPAEQCFAYGRQLTIFHLLDEPSLESIQAVLLITYYMIAACQHNAAFINLGAATRAAYTIGIHLHETNVAFGGEEGLLRERCSVVTMAYYYSIILLTRPFLTFQVRHASTKAALATDNSSTKANLAAYSDACVNSAIKSIDIAHTYVFEQDTPRRRPLVVNSVFISALRLGLASMDPSDRWKWWSMESSLDRAIKILSHLGRLDSQSARYAAICVRLKEAVTTYAARRDNCLLQENDQIVRGIFGDVGVCLNGHLNSGALESGIESPQPPTWSASTFERIGELMTPPPFDFNTIEEEYMLPTSGAGHMEILSRRHYQHDPDARIASDSGVDLLSAHFLDLDVPLFPLASYISPESYLSYSSMY